MTSNWDGHPTHSWNEGGQRRGLAGDDDDNNHDEQQEEEVDNEPSKKIGRQQPPLCQCRVICNALFNHDYFQNAPHCHHCFFCCHLFFFVVTFAVAPLPLPSPSLLLLLLLSSLHPPLPLPHLVNCCLYPSAAITASSSSPCPLS
jgi:hypothetical protein